jgi:[acyl-carrier-protein] S-malonyltransferase
VRETFEETSGIVSIDSWSIVTHGPEYERNTPGNPQPIMLAGGGVVWRVWISQHRCYSCVMVGHSFGEYTALVCEHAREFREQAHLDRSLSAICAQDSDSYKQAIQRDGEVS